jgi:hypothetical protein
MPRFTWMSNVNYFGVPMRKQVKVSLQLAAASNVLRRFSTLACISVFFLFTASSFAQVDLSGLSGTVTDPSGRLLPQARITVVENATGLRRLGVSDSTGNYSFPELAVGTYTVSFEHQGFQKIEFVAVKQVIGNTRTLNATLKVAGGEERVVVSAGSELVDRDTSTVTGLIERKQADELPLNGRDWSGLTAYIPGAIDTGGSNQRSVRFVGRGLDDSNFTYDGVDETSVVNQTQRPWVRLSIPLDAIAEFRVDTLVATAAVGATGGAQLAVASPAGSNQFHGRLFEFLRNNVLDAPEPTFASAGEAQQPLRLNQFGGSLGGPIVPDKTFFFLSSEAYRQVWGYPVSGDVPSLAYRASISPSNPVYAIVNAYPTAGPNAIVAPTAMADIDLLTCACTQVVNESSAMLRLDQHFSSNTTGFIRFNYDRSVDTQPASVSATNVEQRVSTPTNGAVELLHIFSPSLTNEAEFGFNRSTDNTYFSSGTGLVYQIAISQGVGPGFGDLNYDYNTIYVGNTFAGIDNLTWLHGHHTFKFGGEVRRIQLNQHYGEHGTVTFASLATLAADKVAKASLTGALPINDLRKTWYMEYAQDEYKLLQNLTLNLGVRYTIFGLFNEAHGKADPFDFATCGPQGYCGVGASFGTQNYGDVDPRVGLAWSPRNDSRTIIHAGFGMYHEDGQLDDQNLPAKNEVPSYAVTGGTYPVTFPTSTLSPNAEQRNRKDSYTEQWDLSVQQQLPGNFVGTIAYMASHGVHLLETSYVNLLNPAVTPVVAQYPAFAPAINWRGSVGASSYDGIVVSMRRPFAHGLLVAANYSYTHELDNGSNGSGDGDEISPQNPLCQSCEYADGTWDASQVVNGNAVYELPFGHGRQMLNQPGIASAIAGGWQLTTSALARTGFPVNVLLPSSVISPYGNSGTLRPNLVPGVPLTPPGGRTIAHWINPAAFALPAAGTFGDAPRDLFAGPGTWQVDSGLAKTFPLGERAHMEFRSEFYNVFNHPQLGPPNATCTLTTAAPVGCASGFGGITTTLNLNTAIVNPITPVGSGTPREIQFALRLEF